MSAWMSNILWVKIKGGSAAKISTKNCEDVDDFIKTCKFKLQIETSISFINLSSSENEKEVCLARDLLIEDLRRQIGDVGKFANNPIYLHVKQIVIFSDSIVPSINGEVLYQREESANELARALLNSSGALTTPIFNHCYGSGKTHFCSKFRNYISHNFVSTSNAMDKLPILMNAAFIYISFSNSYRNHSNFNHANYFEELILKFLCVALQYSSKQKFSDCVTVDEVCFQIDSYLTPEKRLIFCFDEVGSHDVSEDLALKFVYTLWMIGEKLRLAGHFYMLSGRSEYLHQIGLKRFPGYNSPCPTVLIQLPLLDSNSITCMFKVNLLEDWLKDKLESLLVLTCGVPRLIYQVISFLLSAKSNNRNLDSIGVEDNDLWDEVVSISFSGYSFSLLRSPVLRSLIEISWGEIEVDIKSYYYEQEYLSTIVARYGAYFTPSSGSLCKIVYPLCLLRKWNNWSVSSVYSMTNFSIGDRLENGFRRVFHLRYSVLGEKFSWESFGLGSLETFNFPLPQNKYSRSYTFPKISEGAKKYTDCDIYGYMEHVHRASLDLSYEQNSLALQQFPPAALENICKLMLIGQYYQPLPFSCSADALIRVNENTIIHFQLKNFRTPFDVKEANKESCKCYVKGFKNYCVIFCSSGNSETINYFVEIDSISILILSKESVEIFLGKNSLKILQSKNLTDDSDEKLMSMTPIKNTLNN